MLKTNIKFILFIIINVKIIVYTFSSYKFYNYDNLSKSFMTIKEEHHQHIFISSFMTMKVTKGSRGKYYVQYLKSNTISFRIDATILLIRHLFLPNSTYHSLLDPLSLQLLHSPFPVMFLSS